MNRVFIYLYILIVVSIILVGWSADKLIQLYDPEPEISDMESAFLDVIKRDILAQDNVSDMDVSEYQNSHFSLLILPNDALAKSSLAEKIHAGDTVVLYDSDAKKLIYQRAGNHVIQISTSQPTKNESPVYVVILIVFYVVIGIVIYFWVWPLSRDLGRLQKQTQVFGEDGVPSKVDIGPQSAIFSVAKAFNSMADRIRELVASHKEMTSAVSHELRTPLARMRFALEMAEVKARDEQIIKQLDSIRMDVNEMDALINGLLSYAGFEQQAHTLETEEGDLSDLINKTLELHEHNSNVESQFFDFLDHTSVRCEWQLMERCIHNLIQNGMRYAKSKLIVTAQIKRGWVTVCVEDDGHGIAESDRDKVLQPFVRLASQNKKSGFGLGLAIVNRILKWHGGEVLVSESGLGGASFTLRWPYANSE